MAWQIDNLTLDGDKITEKVGSISISFPNAYLTESFEFSIRFPLTEGTNQQQLTALVNLAESKKAEWISRRTAEDSLKPIILNKLNP